MTEVPLAGNVVLRPATEQDVEALVTAYLRNREHLRRWEPRRQEEFYTHEGQATRLKALLEQQGRGGAMAWVLADGDRVVGRMTLNDIVRGPFLNGHLGYWLDHGYTGRGLAAQGVVEVCRLADQELGLHRIAAGTLLDNVASQAVLRKTGFTPYGVASRYLEIDGRWQDHVMWQRILHDRPA